MSTDFGVIKSGRYDTIAEVYTSIKTDGAVIFIHDVDKETGIKFVVNDDNYDEFITAIETALAFNNSRKVDD